MNNRQFLKQVIENVLAKMTLQGSVVIEETLQDDKRVLLARIESPEASLLIGRNADNLNALECLVRNIVRKNLSYQADPVPVFIDINNYKLARREKIERLAKLLIRQAYISGEPVRLRPMLAFERRIVHLVVANERGVISESVGERGDRCVVISPKNL